MFANHNVVMPMASAAPAASGGERRHHGRISSPGPPDSPGSIGRDAPESCADSGPGLDKFGPDGFDAFAVHAQVAVAHARSRAYVDDACAGREKEFDVVDEAQQRAGILGVQIVRLRLDDARRSEE